MCLSMTLGQMAKLAYDHHILRDTAGFTYLMSKLEPSPVNSGFALPPPTGPAASRTGGDHTHDDLDAVRKGIEQAQSLASGLDDVAANVVVTDQRDDPDEEQTVQYWKARAYTAEASNVSFVKQLQNEKASNTQLKSKLSSSEDAKMKFSAQADLAASRFNEYTAVSTEPVIAALKPKLDCLPEILETVKNLSAKVLALGDVPTQVKGVHDDLVVLSEKIHSNGENCEQNRAEDAETVICLVNRLDKVLAHFGFSSEVPPVNVPQVVSSLLTGTGRDVGAGSPSVHGYYTCNCGCGEVLTNQMDFTRPPPALLAAAPPPSAGTSSTASTVGFAPSVPSLGQPHAHMVPAVSQNGFLLDPRYNNNNPQSSLVHQHRPGVSFQSVSHAQYQPPVPGYQSGSTLKRGGGSSEYPGMFKKPF